MSGSSSLEQGTSAIPNISGILSSLSNASSCEAFIFWNPCRFEAFNQRSSKLVRTSYAAGPSIRLCKSCQGSLGQPVLGPCQSTRKDIRNKQVRMTRIKLQLFVTRNYTNKCLRRSVIHTFGLPNGISHVKKQITWCMTVLNFIREKGNNIKKSHVISQTNRKLS